MIEFDVLHWKHEVVLGFEVNQLRYGGRRSWRCKVFDIMKGEDWLRNDLLRLSNIVEIKGDDLMVLCEKRLVVFGEWNWWWWWCFDETEFWKGDDKKVDTRTSLIRPKYEWHKNETW